MKSLNLSDLEPKRYAARLAEELVGLNNAPSVIDAYRNPNWWQAVLIELHDRLQNELLFNREYQDAPSPSWLERRTLARFGSYMVERYQFNPDWVDSPTAARFPDRPRPFEYSPF